MTTRNQVLAFAFLCAVSILFWWHPLVITLGLALANEAYTHIFLILPLSVSLIYLDRDALRTVSESRIAVGSAALVGAALLACFAQWGQTNILQGRPIIAEHVCARNLVDRQRDTLLWTGSFSIFSVSALLSVLDGPCSRICAERNRAVPATQSTFASRILFLAIGVPVTQDGIMLAIPNLDIEVARECSSIRSSLMLVVTTIGFGSSVPALMVAESSAHCGGNSRCLWQRTDFASSRSRNSALE
jgi:hypothetical protein